MSKKQLLEFIPLGIFLLFGLSPLFKLDLPFASIAAIMSGSFLAMIYFYGSFWLLSETGTSKIIRIIAGLVFGTNFIGCIFCLMHWPYWSMYATISYIGLGMVLLISLFNYKSLSYKPLLYRCILFIIVLSGVYGYRSFVGKV